MIRRTAGVLSAADVEGDQSGRPQTVEGMTVNDNPEWTTAWIGLGSNMQEPTGQLKQALKQLSNERQVECLEQSSFYLTPPWGDENQDDFVNAVVRIKTRLEPFELLNYLQTIEARMGRKRGKRRWGPRLIDLDLLVYGDRKIQSDTLEVPHPRIRERAFVLVPLYELDPQLEIPGLGEIRELIKDVDISAIRKVPPRA